jgi:hypothetical protein
MYNQTMLKNLEITTVTLDTVQRAVNILGEKIGASGYNLPTYGKSEDFARPHIEINARGYHYVVVERGNEIQRKTTHDIYELLYWIFSHITFNLAIEYERSHRIPSKDSRRLAFQKQEELLGILDEDWKRREEARHNQILEIHPFIDK